MVTITKSVLFKIFQLLKNVLYNKCEEEEEEFAFST